MKKFGIAMALCACTLLGVRAANADVIVGTGQPSATTLGQTTATQIRVESRGTGHGLIVPYYTTQNQTATLLNVTNTDLENGKVVKLRIRGAANGDELLSMQILLSPGDVWTASLSSDRSGAAALTVVDTSCTLPAVSAIFPAFSLATQRLNPLLAQADLFNHTREGIVEFLNMADIPAGRFYGAERNARSELADATTVSTESGAPSCAAAETKLSANFANEGAAAAIGLASPTGGLTGRWTIINVPTTLTFTNSMHVVKAVDANGADARANFAFFPQLDTPYPATSVDGLTADPLLRTQALRSKSADGSTNVAADRLPVVTARHSDFPDFSTPYVVLPSPQAALAQAELFTRATAVKSATNEYFVPADLAAKTDMVFSAPARRFSVAVDSSQPQSRLLYSMIPSAGRQFFHSENTLMLMRASDPGQACVRFRNAARSAGKVGYRPNDFVSVPLPTAWDLCGMVSVQSIGAQRSLQDSALNASVTQSAKAWHTFQRSEGWESVNFVDSLTDLGTPMIANFFASAVNPAVSPGISGNFGVSAEHWYKR
jgi:hypothetical protein